ncbi:MAG TPA: alpha-mannosidase, partial [Thermoanaerobaculia bacterium]|nr:alpha-mannosidase [Thermoanaerobaculia bacterium]
MPPSARKGAPKDLELHPTVYLVATSHLDTQWRWTVERTIRDFLPPTVEGNLELFERFPSYVLSFEGAFRYMLVQEYYPELWRQLVDACASGRWQPAGSMLDSPDVNIPAPESLIRHVLYGNSFFARELGRPTRDLFLPDCFGFGFALPSIAAHCGILGFSSQKFIKWMPPAEIPFDLGYWKGPDGRGLVAVLNPDGYGDPIRENLTASPRLERRIERLRRTSGLRTTYMYFGTGDQGGPLDTGSMYRLEDALAGRGEGPIRICHGASDQLFELLTPEQKGSLPVYTGELLLPRHGTGSLTSIAFLKRANRKNEQRAIAAESAATIASLFGAFPYPHEQLRSAWIRFLWHQQHDGITGTSIPRANRIAANDHAVAANLFADARDSAAVAVARGLPSTPQGVATLLVFNPLGLARQDVATVSITFDAPPP